MLEAALQARNDIRVPLHVSNKDFSPPRSSMVMPPEPIRGRNQSSRSPSLSRAPELAPNLRLPGVSGDLPRELARGGHWFARMAGDNALLLTFLPAFDPWRELVSEHLTPSPGSGVDPPLRGDHCSGLGLSPAAATQTPGGGGDAGSSVPPSCANPRQVSTPRAKDVYSAFASRGFVDASAPTSPRPKKKADSDDDDQHSLGLHFFLVRGGDFGIPIELQNWMLQDVRQILLAHIHERSPGTLGFKSPQR